VREKGAGKYNVALDREGKTVLQRGDIMAKGTWAHRARERAFSGLRNEIEAAGKQREQEFEASIPATLAKNKKEKEFMTQVALGIMAKIKPGDSLEYFGLPNVIAAKINKKSITDSNGERWSVDSLRGMIPAIKRR
jgi:hypothetical protein